MLLREIYENARMTYRLHTSDFQSKLVKYIYGYSMIQLLLLSI